MAFQWGGKSWDSNELDEFVAYLNARGVSYSDWADNHPTAAATFYNPQAYVPGQGTATPGPVPQAIQDQGYTDMGNTPLDQIPDIPYNDTSSDPQQPEGTNPVPAPPPGSDTGETGAGYDAAKAAAAAATQGDPNAPYYPADPGTTQPWTPTTPSGNPSAPSTGSTSTTDLNELLKKYPLDWKNILGVYGLDDDIVTELNRIFTVTGGDLTKAIPIATAYVRGTQWYANNYPKIQEGINAGLFDDERGYRTYQNQVNQIYQQYYGRFATPSEAASYMAQGKSVAQVATGFQADALKGTLSDPLKRLFSPEELQAYVNETAGIDSALGQEVTQKADMAIKVNTLYKDFMGRDVTRTELDGLLKNGISAQDVSKEFATTANINAMNPAIRDLFTAAEVREMALQGAGGITQNGQLLQQKAALAAQLNAAYHTYSGAGVTREEVEGAWRQGLTAEEVSNRLQAAQLQGSLPQYLRDIFSEDTLRQAAGATAGSDLSAGAIRSQQIVQGAGAYQSVVRQYENRNVTADELNNFYDQNVTADTVAKRYQGQGIVAAKGQDYQLAAGSFGGQGQFSQEELTQLGQEQAGIDTIVGQQLQERLTKAQNQLKGAFSSAVSKPSLSFVAGKLTTSRGKQPDVGA